MGTPSTGSLPITQGGRTTSKRQSIDKHIDYCEKLRNLGPGGGRGKGAYNACLAAALTGL